MKTPRHNFVATLRRRATLLLILRHVFILLRATLMLIRSRALCLLTLTYPQEQTSGLGQININYSIHSVHFSNGVCISTETTLAF